MTDQARKPLPPYVPYKTFNTFLDHLKAIGMPSHIDKSVMASLSGGMQSWLKAALRYMKLINEKDEPTELLAHLVVSQGAERRAVLFQIFAQSYAFLIDKVDLRNTTPTKLRSAIVEEGAQGETVDKILAFLLAMAKDAGVEMSKLLTTRAPRQARARTKTPKASRQDDADESDDEIDSPADAAMKTITLPKSGGTITLSGDINLFELVGAERDLVFKLIDTMREFEEAQLPEPRNC
jgi:hypothetical protein